MKEKVKGILFSLGYMGLFFVVQTIIMIALVIMSLIKMIMSLPKEEVQRILNSDQWIDQIINQQTVNMVILANLVIMGTLWIITRCRKEKMHEKINFKKTKGSFLLMGALIGIGIYLFDIVLVEGLSHVSFLKESYQVFEEMSMDLEIGNPLIVLIGVGIVGPIAEEVLFRGYIYQTLKKRYSIASTIIIQGVGIATGIMTLLVLIFGEITPKSLSAQNSQKVAAFVAKPIALITIVFSPIVKILMVIANGIIRLFGGKIDTNKPFITEDELKTIVTVSHEEGVLEDEEKEMIYNVFGFGDSYTKDIMIPRTDMIALDITSNYEDILNLYQEEQFSRIPIFEETQDNIVGILYIKDLLLRPNPQENFSLFNFLRKPYFVHEYKRIDELFKEMRLKKIGMAIVIDEYGGTSGLVTLEDLVEEIVGDIDDEYDVTEDKIVSLSENEYLVDGSCRLSALSQYLDVEMSSNEFDSIGGFVIGILDRFPAKGEQIDYENLTFIVEKTLSHRIQKLKVKVHPPFNEGL